MQCKCLSKPKYHRDDCPMYGPDGTPKANTKIEMEFNDAFLEHVGDVIPFYFRMVAHSSFYRLKAVKKSDGENVEFDKIHEYTKEKLREFCPLYFNRTGMHITFE